MIRRLAALANSDVTTMFAATFAIGWGLQRLQQMVKARQNTLAVLDRAVADRLADLDALDDRVRQAGTGQRYPAPEDLAPLVDDGPAAV